MRGEGYKCEGYGKAYVYEGCGKAYEGRRVRGTARRLRKSGAWGQEYGTTCMG